MSFLHVMEYCEQRGLRSYDLFISGNEETQKASIETFCKIIQGLGGRLNNTSNNCKGVVTFRSRELEYANPKNAMDGPVTGTGLGVFHVQLLSEMTKLGWNLLNYSRNPIDRESSDFKREIDHRLYIREREWTFQKEG